MIDTERVRAHYRYLPDSEIKRRTLTMCDEIDQLRAELAAVSEELDRPTDLCPPTAKRDRRYSGRVIADLHAREANHA